MEEKIRIVRKFNQENRYRDCGVLNNAINDILNELERLQKENEELKEIKDKKLDKDLHNNLWICKDLAENYIHKSVVQDKIEKLEKEIRQYNKYAKQGEETDVEFYEKIANEAKIQILYELLEGENTNV